MSNRSLSTPVSISSLILIWAVSWSVRKIALAYAPALISAGLLTLGGGLLMLLVAPARRTRFRWRANWPVYVLSALINVVPFYGLLNIALKFLPSGLLTVLVYLGPVVAGFSASWWLGEALNGPRLLALLLGFAGVALVSVEGFIGHTSLTGILLGVASGIAWGLGTVYTKRISDRVDIHQLVTAQFLLGGTVLTVIGLARGEWSRILWTWPFVVCMLFLMVFNVTVAWSLWYYLVRNGEVTRISTTIFSVPVLAVLIGTFVLGEPFSWFLLGGLALTAAGIYLVNRPGREASSPEAAKM